MTKISELGKISGANTKSRDLFVVVNLDLGEDGTRAITRRELVNAIEQEVFDDIKIEGGYIRNIAIESNNITVEETFSGDMAEDDYFFVRDTSLGATVAMSRAQLFSQIAEVAKKSNKVYVGTEGNDNNSGSYLEPVATLEKAVQMAQAAAAEGIATAISVLPGDYYTNGNLALPDLCTMVSTNGQYATKIIMNPGYEKENCILLGSGCYVQGFSFFNLQVDNFDYPSKGFAFAFRPGVRIIRSPYVRDSSQLSNYFSREIAPLLKPTNSKGTIEDLGYEITISSVSGNFEVGDSITTSDGVTGFVSRNEEIGSGVIYIRNNIGDLNAGTTINSSSGGSATITAVGEEDFPNKEVGRGGGMILADRSVVDQDSIFPYILAFGATPRTQNGLGYVAKNGAGINGISSLSIFARCAFYALDGGQITLNNSGTQFGDISMRAKGVTPVFSPRSTDVPLVKNEALADTLESSANTIIDDLWTYITDDLGYQGYDSVKCRRDVGYILSGVGYDITLGTNYWGVVNGIAYRRAGSSVVIDEQLTETSTAISFVKEQVRNILTSTAAETRSDASFDEIIDILENGTSAADSLTFTNTGNDDHANARTLLVVNKSRIQDDLISWINENYPDLDYEETTCRRDAGYIIDALSHDLNYNSNIATILNAEAYFVGTASQLPLDQREPTALAIEQLGTICSSIMLGIYENQSNGDGLATQTEADRCVELTDIIKNVILKNTLQELPARREPDLSWVDEEFVNSKEVIEENVTRIQAATISFVNTSFEFIDENLTRRDALNLIRSISNDYREGTQKGTRIFVSGLFNYQGKHVFSVFNPPTSVGLTYKGSIASLGNLPVNPDINDAYILYSSETNIYDGTVYYWDGSNWVSDGANDISLLNAFTGSWDRMRDFIKANITLTSTESTMLDGLVDEVLIASVRNPRIVNFGSLVESLSHQFNLASAGVNVNALPLNFRRLGEAVSAATSVLQEEGGRVRWSGADELNNQYFARGLKINGRTGRIEGRPFTSSVRKLARRASNSRAFI